VPAAGALGGIALKLTVGTTLGHYRIVSLLGKGGMGEVYAADDLSLGRRVALKVLPEQLTGSGPALERFRREARAAATINHPNIVTVHSIEESDGIHFLTMEVVDGVALDASMKTPGTPLDRLLDTGIAIADALGAAHDRGIVHRDLTPRNVMVTKDGRVKVLDFGLARLRDVDSPAGDQHAPATTTTPLTGAHQIVGTPAYMSPEQVEGKAIDQRSDLFSLGTMLYEMASGERPFKGDSAISILSSIVRDAPRPLSEVVPVQPRGLWRIVRRALAKDVEARYQSAKDLRNDLRELKHDLESGDLGSATVPAVVGRPRLPVVALLVAGIAGLIAGWLLLGRGWREAPVAADGPRQVIRFQITNPMPAMPRPELAHQSVAITRDGSMIAYGTPSEDRTSPGGRLYLRSLDGTTRPASELASAFTPVFSPAGDRLAFRVGYTRYYVTSVKGGAPVLAMEPVLGSISTAAWWGQDGLVYENFGTLYRKTLSGSPEVFAKPDAKKRETYYYGASATPDGRAIVFTIVREDTESFDRAVIAVKDLETGVQKVLISGGMSPQVTTTGHLLFGRAGALHAVAIDTSRWEVRGSPVAVVDDIVTEPADGLTPYAISDNGTLVYLQGRAQRYRRQVVVFDRRGRETPLLESGPYSFVRASPTGEHVALSAYGANVRTWLFDLRRKTLGLLTETWSNEGPAWSHDGTRLAHSSTRGGETELYVAGVQSPSETKLQGGNEISSIKAFSADDRYVLVSDFGDIFRIRSDGSGGKEALVTSGAREGAPTASPEGTWLAFQSDDTGQFEVYVVPYASGGRRQQVSRNGGQHPQWTMRGRELCYRAGLTMSSIACVAIGPDGSPIGESRVVVNLEDTITSWDVSPDGQHFYVIKNAIEGWQPTAPLQVVVNWFDELRAKLAQSEK